MANIFKLKKESVIIELDKERELKFRMSEFAKLEEKHGSIENAMEQLQTNGVNGVMDLLMMGLGHYGEDAPSREALMELITLPDLAIVSQAVTLAMSGDAGNDLVEKAKEEASIAPISPVR